MDQRTRQLLERIRLFAMPKGPVQCRGTWLRQVGEMRFGPDRPWFPFHAEQWYEGDGIEFRWKAQARMTPLLRASVSDVFEGGRGVLVAKLLGVIPVARSRGPATDRGEAMRGAAELPWRPFAFRESRLLTWEVTASGSLRARYDDGGTQTAVEFEVDHDGRVLRCSAPDRPRLVGKEAVDTPWSGKMSDYAEFDGVLVPTRAEVAWTLPDGPFTYWRAKVTDFRVLP
jgi:hypothetical protein